MSHSIRSEKEVDEIAPVETTHNGDIETRRESVVDAVFGQISKDGPNYRNVRISAVVLFPQADRF